MALSEYTMRLAVYLTAGEHRRFEGLRKKTDYDKSGFCKELIRQGLIEVIKTNGLELGGRKGKADKVVVAYISLVVRKKFVELRPKYHDKDSGFGRDLINLAMNKMELQNA